MSSGSRGVLVPSARPASSGGDHPARTRRSLLALLAQRAFSGAAALVGPVGRLFLYVGLLLVALSALRLPNGMGALADAFLLAGMVCSFFRLVQGHPLRIGVLKLHLIGLGLLITGIITATLAGTSSDDWGSLLQLSKFVFATTATVVTCMVLLERRSQVQTALGCWVLSSVISSFVALLQASIPEAIGYDVAARRMTGLSENPNGLGPIAGMAIAGGMALAAASDRLKRVAWLIATLLCVAGVIASASRAGAIVAVFSLAIWGMLFYPVKREFTVLALGCCLAGAAVASLVFVQVWSGGDLSDRLANATDPYADGAVASRLHQYEDVLRAAFQNPLIGVGLASSEIRVSGNVIHNTLLTFFHAGGVLSLAGIIIIFADLLLKGIETYRCSGSRGYAGMAAALLAGVVGLILTGLAGPILYQRRAWVPAALLLTLFALAKYRTLGSKFKHHHATHKQRSSSQATPKQRPSKRAYGSRKIDTRNPSHQIPSIMKNRRLT